MSAFEADLLGRLAAMEADGTARSERAVTGSQRGRIDVGGREMLNLCANNYLGLADDPRLVEAAANALHRYGYGMASVRFICGTHDLHHELETALAAYLGKEDAILFAACFDANGGLFEALLGPEDAVVSDALNHASIIDGIRLSKARRFRYANADMDELEASLTQARAAGARHVLIATDGVFSMDGTYAPLAAIVRLARRYGATVMVDDCHATGIVGPRGAGTHAREGVVDGIDILTGTLGKALGGAIGGYVAGSHAVVETLRQRSRPYLFSNALPPMVCAASLGAIAIASGPEGDRMRRALADATRTWRAGLAAAGFRLLPGDHPIVPVMVGDAMRARRLAQDLDQQGVYVAAFAHPVVPHGMARIRTQMSAGLTPDDLAFGLRAFADLAPADGPDHEHPTDAKVHHGT